MKVVLNKQIKLSRPQKKFLESTADRVLIGGARGGGKSYVAVLLAVLLVLNHPGCRVLFVRPTIKSAMKQFLSYLPKFLERERVHNGKKEIIWTLKKQEGVITFANGSEVVFGGVQTEAEAYTHQGIEYTFIIWDELTKSDWEAIQYVIGSLRSTQYKPRFYATTNPGERSHSEVKKAYIDPHKKLQALNKKLSKHEEPYETWTKTPRDEDGNPILNGMGDPVSIEYEFIPTTVYDNPDEAIQVEYLKILAAMPAQMRDMYLYGDWDSFEGQMFTHFDEVKHTFSNIDEIPFKDCDVYMSMDKGWHDANVGIFHACDRYTGVIYKFGEIYESQITFDEFAEQVIKRRNKYGFVIKQLILPWDMFTETSNARTDGYGTVIGNRDVDSMVRKLGSPAVKASRNRAERWRKTNSLLAANTKWTDEDGDPMESPKVMIHTDCVNLIHQYKYTRRDMAKPDDIAKNQEDHAIDADGYFNITFYESELNQKYVGKTKQEAKPWTGRWLKEQKLKQLQGNRNQKPRRRYS